MKTALHRHRSIFIVVLATLCQAALAQPIMEAGGWEMQGKVSAKNAANGELKTVNESSSKVCLSPEFIAKDPYLTPGIDKAKMEQKQANCAISDEKRSPDSASWKMTCTTVDGHIVEALINNKIVSAHQIQSDIKQQVERDGKKAQVSIAMTGKFIGPCRKDMPTL